jgi:hypothetical protein
MGGWTLRKDVTHLTRLFLLLLLLYAAPAWAQVCAPATAPGSGTTRRIPAGTSWGTIQNTINTLGPGDNLLFQRGAVFNATSQLVITRDGTASNKILIGVYGTGPNPVIDGYVSSATNIPATHFYGINFSGANHVIWDGVDLRDMLNGHAITIQDNSNFVTVRRSRISVARAACVKINEGSDDITFEFNQVSGCGTPSPVAGAPYHERIYVGTDLSDTTTEDVVRRPVLRYNTLIGGSQDGIEFKPGVRDGLIEGNLIRNGLIGIHVSHWPGNRTQNNNIIRYNLVRDITGNGRGIIVKSGGEIHHNVVANVGGTNRPGIEVDHTTNSSQAINAHHNTVYNASGPGILNRSGETVANNLVRASGSGNFAQDPLFFNPAAFDFRIPVNSPAARLGAYAPGEALREVGHTACLGE